MQTSDNSPFREESVLPGPPPGLHTPTFTVELHCRSLVTGLLQDLALEDRVLEVTGSVNSDLTVDMIISLTESKQVH